MTVDLVCTTCGLKWQGDLGGWVRVECGACQAESRWARQESEAVPTRGDVLLRALLEALQRPGDAFGLVRAQTQAEEHLRMMNFAEDKAE